MKKLFVFVFVLSFAIAPAVGNAGFFDFFKINWGGQGAQVREALTSKAKGEVLGLGDKDLSILEVQLVLKKLGYYHGKLSGVFGPRTEDAIELYQKINDLDVTGELDSALFDKILGRDDGEGEERSMDLADLQVKAFLGGSYNSVTGLMSTGLNDSNLIPEIEPYTDLFDYDFVSGGDEEIIDPAVMNISGENAIIDWVVVELRSSVDAFTPEYSRAALIQADGDIVDIDGVSPLPVPFAPGNHYVSVIHRNHLVAMTANPVDIGDPVDMTTLPLFGTNAAKVVSGVQVLWPGDVSFDGEIMYTGFGNDRDLILSTIGGAVPTNTITGYYNADVNMDGIVKYTGTNNDRDIILASIGGIEPGNTILAQLPETTTCLMADMASTQAVVDTDFATFEITFDLTATSNPDCEDIYISKNSSLDDGTDMADQGTTFGIDIDSAFTEASTLMCDQCNENVDSFIVEGGETQEFTLTVVIDPAQDTPATIWLDSINWSDALGAANKFYSLNTGQGSAFQTPTVFITD